MPKKAIPPLPPPAPRFQGKTFALAGLPWSGYTDRATKLIAAEGGRLIDDITATLDFLVSYHSNRAAMAARKKVLELNKSGAAIRILAGDQFNDLFLPDADLALGLLRSGPAGIERFNLLRSGTAVVLDLGAIDLRDLPLAGANLERVNLDGADLRGANLSKARLPLLAGVRLDGANLHEARITGFLDCNLRNANLTRAYHDGKAQPLERSDFTGANLTVATLCGFVPAETVFRKANLEGVNWNGGRLKGADFRRLNLGKASFARADLTGAQLAGARLDEANLYAADLTGADLTRADLRGAVLIDANLSQATLDGANFAGANLIGANLAGCLGKARGLDSARTVPPGKVGPNIQEWEKLAGSARRLETTARIALPNGLFTELSVETSGNARWLFARSNVLAPYSARFDYRVASKTVSAALVELPSRWADGSLQLESITAEATGAALRGRALTHLAIKAWCEGCGVPVPSADDLKALEQKIKDGKRELHEQMLADLRGGPGGAKRWNERGKEEREKAGHFRKADLSGAKLDGVTFVGFDFSGADLSGASLREANLYGARFAEASFKGADLCGAKLRRTRLGKANFKGADLTGADLLKANLCGADLAKANLTDAVLVKTRFDGTTVFPTGFALPEVMQWAGDGPDPRSAATPVPAPRTTAAGTLDLEALLQRLQQSTASGRLANALTMLKADRFRLFSQVEDNGLVGVVKSQTDAALVYSCRLASDGSYSCCTQNLRPCGGLAGALCKHLLVLIVGLAKGGQLDPATVDGWVQASRTKKPALDKDAAGAVFLRYKGAEAGEVDWRPTETIPEDFYAF